MVAVKVLGLQFGSDLSYSMTASLRIWRDRPDPVIQALLASVSRLESFW